MAYLSARPQDLDQVKMRAHDTRGLSTTWAQLAGLPMEEILQAAAWKVPVTFISHYMKDLTGTKGRFGRTVLLTAGPSVPSTR